MEIIPAIDIIDGKCVRLTQGDFLRKKVYANDPLDIAKTFEDNGIRRLHLVDLDGAKCSEVVNYKTLERIAAETSLEIDFGGGIKNSEIIQRVYNAGAKMASVGSIAVKNKTLFIEWLNTYGAERILLGADVRGEMITVSGWLEETNLPVIDFLKEYSAIGVENVFCTDVSKDGYMQGPSIDLYKRLISIFPELNIIASGGVSSITDVNALRDIGCSGVIIGKAIYEGKIGLNELKNMSDAN